MLRNFYLSLVLITLLSCIIIPGCGGGSNSINPASFITTPTPNIPGGGTGYITIKIVWPQAGKTGKCIMSSENTETDITASMPGDTNRVVVEIYDKNDTTEPLINGTHKFLWGIGKLMDKHTFGPLPTIKAIVIAKAYHDENGEESITPISVAEQKFQIKPGMPEDNAVDLALGDYELTVDPYDSVLTLPPQSRIGANGTSDPISSPSPGTTPDISPTPQDTPTPSITPPSGGIVSTTITARLMIVYPSPAPNPAPEPDTTAIPVSTPKPAEHKLINFRLLSGTASLSPITGYTNSEGYCTTTLTADTTGTNIIEASFEPDSNDPDNAYKQTCQVEVEGGEADETYYAIELGSSVDSKIVVNGRTTIYAILRKNKYPDWEAAPGKTINFKVIPSYGASVNSSATTDNEGACYITFTGTAAGSYSVEAEFKDPASDPEKPPFTASYPIEVINDLIWEDDFEAYTPGIWPESNWTARGDVTSDTANQVATNSGNQVLQLHSNSYGMALRPMMIEVPCEVKFDIRIGSGDLNGLNQSQNIGFGSFSYFGDYSGHNFLWFDLFRDSQEGDKRNIYGLNSHFGSYNPGTWYTVHVRFGKEPKITYWVNGYNTVFTDISPVNYQNYAHSHLSFGLNYGSTMWVDNIKVYSRHGLDD
jgi:hypothetical protein